MVLKGGFLGQEVAQNHAEIDICGQTPLNHEHQVLAMRFVLLDSHCGAFSMENSLLSLRWTVNGTVPFGFEVLRKRTSRPNSMGSGGSKV